MTIFKVGQRVRDTVSEQEGVVNSLGTTFSPRGYALVVFVLIDPQTRLTDIYMDGADWRLEILTPPAADNGDE